MQRATHEAMTALFSFPVWFFFFFLRRNLLSPCNCAALPAFVPRLTIPSEGMLSVLQRGLRGGLLLPFLPARVSSILFVRAL